MCDDRLADTCSKNFSSFFLVHLQLKVEYGLLFISSVAASVRILCCKLEWEMGENNSGRGLKKPGLTKRKEIVASESIRPLQR